MDKPTTCEICCKDPMVAYVFKHRDNVFNISDSTKADIKHLEGIKNMRVYCCDRCLKNIQMGEKLENFKK